jgi:hypothetical protein
MNQIPKSIILTIDYEIHFGSSTGTVKDCMIDPTDSLIKLCEKNNCKMTVFWDILHYYRLLQLENYNIELRDDRELIEKQIQELVRKGHDIQLHIHPHWIDAEYVNSKWLFSYDRFSLSELIECGDINDINSIAGCISISKKLVEKVVKNINPNSEVNTIRAGGYLIEPFNFISKDLKNNNIFIDSSICPNRKVSKGKFSYDFNGYPQHLSYRFEDSPSKLVNDGAFIEIPIKSIHIKWHKDLYFKFLKKIKYKDIEKFRKGSGSGAAINLSKSKRLRKKLKGIFISNHHQLTSDNCFKEKYDFLIKKSENYSVQILHPKLLSKHMIDVMQDYLERNEIIFLSINDFILKKKQ